MLGLRCHLWALSSDHRIYCWPCLLRPLPVLHEKALGSLRVGRWLWPGAGRGKVLAGLSSCLFLHPKGSLSLPLENIDSLNSLILKHSTNFIECTRLGSGDASKSYSLSNNNVGKLGINPTLWLLIWCLLEYHPASLETLPTYWRSLRVWNSFPLFGCSSHGFLYPCMPMASPVWEAGSVMLGSPSKTQQQKQTKMKTLTIICVFPAWTSHQQVGPL